MILMVAGTAGFGPETPASPKHAHDKGYEPLTCVVQVLCQLNAGLPNRLPRSRGFCHLGAERTSLAQFRRQKPADGSERWQWPRFVGNGHSLSLAAATIFVSDLDRPLCHPWSMVLGRVTPVHHQMIMVGSASHDAVMLDAEGRHPGASPVRPHSKRRNDRSIPLCH
jgi:hypothetical protein